MPKNGPNLTMAIQNMTRITEAEGDETGRERAALRGVSRTTHGHRPQTMEAKARPASARQPPRTTKAGRPAQTRRSGFLKSVFG